MKRINIILSGILLMQLQNPVLGMEMKITPVGIEKGKEGKQLPAPEVYLSINNEMQNDFLLNYNNSKLVIKKTSKSKEEIPQKLAILDNVQEGYKTILKLVDTQSNTEYILEIVLNKIIPINYVQMFVTLYQGGNRITTNDISFNLTDITKQDSYLIKLTLEGINLGKSELEIFPSTQ